MSSARAAVSGWHGLGYGLLAVSMLVPVTLPVPVLRGLVTERFDVSVTATALFMSINMIGAFLAAPVAGALADRFGRRRRIIVAALLVDGCCLLLMAAPGIRFWPFMGLRFVEGCAHIFALSLLLSLAADAADPARRGRMMGIVGGGITLGVALGAPIGGQLGEIGPIYPLEVGGLLLFGSALLAAVILDDAEGGRNRPGFRELWGMIREQRAVAVPLVYAFCDRFTVGFFTAVFPLFMKEVHGAEPTRIGILLGCMLGPFAVLSYPFGRLSTRVSRTLLVAGGSLGYGLLLMTLGWWPPPSLPYVMAILGVLSAVMFVPALIMVTDLTGDRIRSVAMGGFNAAGSLGFIAGPLVGGQVVDALAPGSGPPAAYTAAFAVAGLSEVVCVLLTVAALRRLIRRGATT